MGVPDSLQPNHLEGLTVRELESLAEEVREAATRRRQERAQELLEELREKAEAEGLTLEDILECGARTRSRLSGQGFQNPANPEERWHGRGRRPQWVKDALSAGKSLDELRA